MIWAGADVIITEKKCTINLTRFNYPESVGFPTPVLGEIVFHKTDLWAQRGWGPLHYVVYLYKGVGNWGLCSMEEVQLTDNSNMATWSRDGGGEKSSRNRRSASLGSRRPVWKPAWEEPGNWSEQGGRTSPQEQSHSPRAKSSAVFSVQYFIYSALGSISTLLLFHKAET